jgi:flagellin
MKCIFNSFIFYCILFLVLGFVLSWHGSRISKNSKIGSRVEHIKRSTQIKEDFKMGLRIQNNIAALNTHRQMQISDLNLSRSLERLSSGYRINRAADDAAGLSVSMKFRAQIRSLYQASRNASEGNSLLQVAEGGADQISGILTRMKELATQAASANTTSADRTNINSEVTTLKEEIDRIAKSTKYGTTALIDGTFGTTNVTTYGALGGAYDVNSVDVSGAAANTTYSVVISTSGTNKVMTISLGGTQQAISVADGSIADGESKTLNFSSLGISVVVNSEYDQAANLSATGTMSTGALGASTFQVGSGDDVNDRIAFNLGDMTAAGLVIDAIDVNSQSGAQTALGLVDAAIGTLATRRSEIGVTQNRFGFTIANIATSVENITAAESVIRDADLAFETIAFTKNQILLQAGTAMLAQANIAPQSILGVLG